MAKFIPLLHFLTNFLTWNWSGEIRITNDSDLKVSICHSWQFSWDIRFWSAVEEFTSEKQLKCFTALSVHCRGDVQVWFVAQSMFLTDHWNLPAQITRWITASLQWNMSDTLFCYLSFNRQLIALLSVRCLRSTLHSVTHSLDLIVFLMVEASVARHWRNDASQAISIFREPAEKASLLPKVEILILLSLFFSLPILMI